MLVQEPDTDVLSAMLEAVDDIIDVVDGPAMLGLDQLRELFERFLATFKLSDQRRQERLARTKQEDFDEEEAEALLVCP